MAREMIQACATKTCGKDAKVYPVFLVPPKGAPKSYPDEDKVRMAMRLPLCDTCADKLNPRDFFQKPNQRAMIEAPMRQAGRVLPDFKKITVIFMPIDEGESGIFEKTHGK